jgi:hypothetical protein
MDDADNTLAYRNERRNSTCPVANKAWAMEYSDKQEKNVSHAVTPPEPTTYRISFVTMLSDLRHDTSSQWKIDPLRRWRHLLREAWAALVKMVTHDTREEAVEKRMGSKTKLDHPLQKYVCSKESMQE